MPPVDTPVYCGNGRSAWPSVAFPPINCLKFGNGGWKPRATTAGSSMGLFSRVPRYAYFGSICMIFTRSEARWVPLLPVYVASITKLLGNTWETAKFQLDVPASLPVSPAPHQGTPNPAPKPGLINGGACQGRNPLSHWNAEVTPLSAELQLGELVNPLLAPFKPGALL